MRYSCTGYRDLPPNENVFASRNPEVDKIESKGRRLYIPKMDHYPSSRVPGNYLS
jgi:hypothetical protein